MKKIILIMFTFISMFIFMGSVNASSATISVKTNASKLVVGKTVKVTVTVSSSSPLGSWEYSLNYDKDLTSFVSSDYSLRYAGVASNGNIKTVSYSYTFKAIKSGTAKFYISASDVLGWDESSMSVANKQASVNIMTEDDLIASYSKDNYLKALSVEGYTLSPEFSKDNLIYSLEIDPTVTSINVIATKNDSKASVRGAGKIDLTEGLNKIDITVTAENGNTKVYVINANVKELSPIIVSIDNQEYTVIRNLEGITIPNGYLERKITINNEEVTSYYNETADYTLVALKDSEGASSLYLYNEDGNSFTRYIELHFNSLNIRPLSIERILKGFTKETMVINDISVEILKKENITYLLDASGKEFPFHNDLILLYGVNLETGYEGYYTYDDEDKTLQRYIEINFSSSSKDDNNVYLIIIGILSFTNILLLSLNIFSKKDKKVKEKKDKIKIAKEEKNPSSNEENLENKSKSKKSVNKSLEQW